MDNIVNMDLGLKKLKKYVCYNRTFVITRFVITKFHFMIFMFCFCQLNYFYKVFFLTGDKSILLAQEMIPGEVFGKVSLKSNFNLFNDSRNVLFFCQMNYFV